ncbi:MAG: CARDB domain-containing protein, partial [Myxococcaceae bacterium]
PFGASNTPHIGSLADLRGLGRPQLVTNSSMRALTLQDGRDGRLLLPISSSLGFPLYDDQSPPVVADLKGDGSSRVVLPYAMAGSGTWYGPAEALVFASPHWKKMPTAWPTRNLVKGRIDENLHVTGDYQWWKSHNTWNQQFDQSPSTLKADLVVRAGDVSATPNPAVAGAPVAVSALIHNIGGLPASNVEVTCYDGDPASGGKPVGDAVVPGPIPERTGSATATVTWPAAYPEGIHEVFCVANSDSAVDESGRENNTAPVRLFVQPGTQLCDLAMVAGSLTATPAAPAAGGVLTLLAQVTNAGPVPCGAAELSIYDGAPPQGVLLGAAAIPALGPGQTASLWVSTTAVPGTSFFRFIADEAGVTLDGDRVNNQAGLQFYVPASTLPDLLVSRVSASPTPALPGETVTVVATVRNLGAPSPMAAFAVVMGASTVVSGVVPPLLPGASATITAQSTAPAASAEWVLLVDPQGAVAEFNEANNSVSFLLEVEDSGLALEGAATPAAAGPDATVSFALTLRNLVAAPRETLLDAQMIGPDGSVLATLLSGSRYVLDAAGVSTASVTWNTARLSPGAYRLRASLSTGGRVATTLEVPVTVLPEAAASTSLVADRGSYHPGQEALLSQRTYNQSRNAPLAGASVTIRIEDGTGLVLYSSLRQLPTLPPGGFHDTADLFGLSAHLLPGAFQATSELRDASGTVLGQAVTNWQLTYQATQLVTGVAGVPSPFGVGQALPVSIELSNLTALPLGSGQLRAYLLDATSLQAEAIATQPVTLASGQHLTVTMTLGTSGISTGQKLVVVQLDGRTLSRALTLAITRVDNTPPQISISGVTDLLLINLDVVPVIDITDESAFTATMTLDGQPFLSGTQIGAEGHHLLTIAAVDAFNNASGLVVRFDIDKTPPVLALAGVASGDVLNTAVELTYAATDLH